MIKTSILFPLSYSGGDSRRRKGDYYYKYFSNTTENKIEIHEYVYRPDNEDGDLLTCIWKW